MKRKSWCLGFALFALAVLGPPVWAQSGVTGSLNASSTDCSKSRSCLILNIPENVGGATLKASGTMNVIMQFEVSADPLTVQVADAKWVAISAAASDGSGAATSATESGSNLSVAWQANVTGYRRIRIRLSTYTSGAVAAAINLSTASARSEGSGGGGGGSITACTTSGGIAYENGTNNTLTCGVNLQYNSASRNEIVVGKGITNIVDSGQAGISFINALAASNTFGLLESTSTDGGFALSFAQAGRAAGGMTLQGAGGTIPGGMENGVFGISDPTAVTEVTYIPDSGMIFNSPTGNNFINFIGPQAGPFPNHHGQIFWDDVGNALSINATDNVAFSPSLSLNGSNGTMEFASGDGSIVTDVSAAGNWVFPVNVKAATFSTATNCAANGTAANPSVAACGAASAGMFSCATAATTGTCQVNTTAVTANSEIFITQDAADGGASQLNVTCNTALVTPAAKPILLSKNTGTSFTINLGTVSVNPGCFEYHIVN